MANGIFTEPDDTHERWVDVRMSDPEKGEWDVDVVVVNGRVEYVDLRVRPEALSEFMECLIDDVGDQRADTIVREVIDRKGLDVRGDTADERPS